MDIVKLATILMHDLRRYIDYHDNVKTWLEKYFIFHTGEQIMQEAQGYTPIITSIEEYQEFCNTLRDIVYGDEISDFDAMYLEHVWDQVQTLTNIRHEYKEVR